MKLRTVNPVAAYAVTSRRRGQSIVGGRWVGYCGLEGGARLSLAGCESGDAKPPATGKRGWGDCWHRMGQKEQKESRKGERTASSLDCNPGGDLAPLLKVATQRRETVSKKER